MSKSLSCAALSRAMRAARIGLTVAAASFAGAAFSVSAQAADVITVVLDQAKVLQLPPNTSTIIVGNPGVADVTTLKRNNQMVLTGKSYGQTNMIALDAEGNSVGESIVRVVGPNVGLVVQRGLERETYSCLPRCQPTINLGDAARYVTETSSQIKVRNGTAAAGPDAAPTAPK